MRGYKLRAAGAQVHLIDEGEGPLVVLAHGSPVSGWSFRRQILRLRGSFRVVAPDLLGFGGSEQPEGGASFGRQAEVLAGLLPQLGQRVFALGGHDWGGPIALGAASMLPEGSLERVILINTTLRPGFRPPLYWRPLVGRVLGDRLVVRLNLTRWMLPVLMRAPREVRAVYGRALASVGTREAVLALERLEGLPALLQRVQRRGDLFGLRTLVAWGHPDPYFRPPECRRLAGLFRDVRVVELGGAGHFPQEDGADALAAALMAFLQE